MEKKIFVTHNSVFHADEVMATAILFHVFGTKNVVRTNNPKDYVDNPEAIVYDIGFGEFDHHQKGGNGTRENGVPYASCGLIWKRYGIVCIENIISFMVKLELNPEDFQEIANTIDTMIIQGIDAQDNGYKPDPCPSINNFSISSIISNMNNIGYYGGVGDAEQQDALFSNAVGICSTILLSTIRKLADSISSENKVCDLILNRGDKHILVLHEYMPWTKTVLEYSEDDEIWYVIFPSSRNKGEWNMQAVPVALNSFEQRHPVPESWWGGNKETLPKITGVESASFCHQSNGFLTAAGSLDDIITLARIACGDE